MARRQDSKDSRLELAVCGGALWPPYDGAAPLRAAGDPLNCEFCPGWGFASKHLQVPSVALLTTLRSPNTVPSVTGHPRPRGGGHLSLSEAHLHPLDPNVHWGLLQPWAHLSLPRSTGPGSPYP